MYVDQHVIDLNIKSIANLYCVRSW